MKLVTHDFRDADVVFVIKVLAKDMRRNVYIGPEVEGSVTMNFTSVMADSALAAVLKEQSSDIRYKLVGNSTLIVASADMVDCIAEELKTDKFIDRARNCPGNHRQEILLESAQASQVIDFLQSQYKDMKFIPHPTLNGFYAIGSRAEIRQMKNDVLKLDLSAVP